MEQWDTTFIPSFPVSWLINAAYPSLPCYPTQITAEQTIQSNNGNSAVKLEAKYCIDDGGVQQVYIGFLAYGNTNNPQLLHGIPYNQRPAQLNFYYKFNRVEVDTGFAKIVLRLLDSAGYAGQIIGEGKVSIINNTNIYTQITVPINYFLPDTPEIIQIVFSTSKTLTDLGYLNTIPGNGANIGTTLWIDDVTVSGGNTGKIENQEISSCKIYPNPFHDYSTITFENSKKENCTLKLYNSFGQLVRSYNDINADKIVIKRQNLTSGLYYFRLGTGKQTLTKGNLLIE